MLKIEFNRVYKSVVEEGLDQYGRGNVDQIEKLRLKMWFKLKMMSEVEAGESYMGPLIINGLHFYYARSAPGIILLYAE